MIEDGWARSAGGKLHYLSSGDSASTPLVYVPGGLGSASQFEDEMIRLHPRRCVAVSPRGMGKSAAPANGYGLDDRVADLAAVLESAKLGPACVMAFSMGVPPAIRLAARRPDLVRGLPHLRLELFEDAGHEVFRPDYERFMRTIEAFLTELDETR